MQNHLRNCGSAEHRALLGLIPPILGQAHLPGLEDDLRASNPEKLAAIAQAHHMHTALALAFQHAPELRGLLPADFHLFCDEILAANHRRNAAARQQAESIATILAPAGHRAAILKGGAELFRPHWSDAAGRFLQDLDILVDAPGEEALDLLLDHGYHHAYGEAAQYSPSKHHFPALSRDGEPLLVELHTSLVPGPYETALPPARLFENASRTETPGLWVPSPLHRCLHHVLHSRAHHRGHDKGSIFPRTIIDHLAHMQALNAEDRGILSRICGSTGVSAHLSVLDRLAELITEGPAEEMPRAERRRTRSALRKFGQPRGRKATAILVWLGGVVKRGLLERRWRERYFRMLLSPNALAEHLAHHVHRFRRIR